ncbi:MAG: hypothetical protein J4G18_04005 [Anaerolineae bacterium]|nr:hypothetical protein [Anaerolineae bacterium]
MVSKKLLDEVLGLDENDKLHLLQMLLRDPAMAKYAFDPIGLHANYEAAAKLMEFMEQEELKRESSIE